MSTHYHRLIEFFKELRRRKVIQVITVYAAASFVVLELVDILAPSLRLPEWTLNLVLLLLCVGFVIAVIVSWIYDIHPEGGIVKTEPAHKVKADDISTSSNNWKIASYISFVVIVGLIALNIVGGKRGARIDESLVKTIAVLPFHNLTGDSNQDFISLGLTDEIISHLYKVESFKEVRSFTSVRNYRDPERNIPVIAEELQVNYILEGTYKKIGDELKITAQLIEPKKDYHIWLEDYELPYKEIIGIPGEIALQIANHLKAFITEDEKRRIEKVPTNNLDAYEYYLLGKNQIYRVERAGDDELQQAVEYFQQAVITDSTFALAYSGLAEAYYQIINYAIQSPKDTYPKAKASALKALSLDDGLAESHCMLALIKASFEYDFDGAEKEYKRALEVDPNSLEAHLYYSIFLSLMGRHDEAVSLINIATELDPFSTLVEIQKTRILYYAGYKSEAIEAMEEFRDLYPENPFGYWFCAVVYAHLGRYADALSMLKVQIPLMGDDNISDEVGLRGYLYGKLGQREKALKQLDHLDVLSSEGYYIAPRARIWVYLGLNEIDTAIEILNESLYDHIFNPFYLKIYPSEFVQLDPRFIELQKKLGIIK